MTLQEFLLTASTDHVTALNEARDYVTYEPVFITSNTLTVYVVGAGLYDVFTDVAADASSPVRGICLALMDRLRGQSEFNLSESLPLGEANIEMLDTLIAALPAHADAITRLKNTLLSISNKAVQPFINTTLHDVLVLRNACPVKPVSALNGWVTITANADCPAHNPRLLALNPRTEQWQRVNSFYGVSAAGSYDAQVQREWLGAALGVDDAYGVI